MKNYWAIAIGINQYHYFQPLLYAQRDAQALYRFWVDEAKFAPDRCVLLADISTAVEPAAQFPNLETIQSTLETFCKDYVQPGDFLWVFFSGYGVQVDGRDYLMPVGGNPNDVLETGLPFSSLYTTLKSAPTDHILVMLDMNRSQSTLAGQSVGSQVIQFAQEHDIATFLSCSPHQFSHETLGLRHGLYAAAVLEALRYEGCMTPEHLAQYISDRLPELSDHHWRPRQEPLALIPIGMRYQLILPGKTYDANDVIQPEILVTEQGAATATVGNRSNRPSPVSVVATPVVPSVSPNGSSSNGKGAPLPTTAPPSPHDPSVAPEPTLEESTERALWQRLMTGLLLTALAMCGLVLFKNWNTLVGTPEASLPPETPQPQSPSPVAQVTETPSPGEETTADQPSPVPPSPSPVLPQPPSPITETTPSVAPSPTASPPSPSPFISSEGDSVLYAAQTAIQMREYDDALQYLDQVPPEQQTEAYNQLLAQASEGVWKEAKAALGRPRSLSEVNQASDYNMAIRLARRIEPDHPFYKEAQRDIRNWSQMIVDLAWGRATQPNRGSTETAARNYHFAIKAAQLVPRDQTQAYNQAQGAVVEWSQAILNLAYARAKDGELELAIKAAEYVPSNTPPYEEAQQAIAEWKNEL